MLIAFESRQKSFSSVDTNRRAAFAQQRSIANHRQPNPTPAIEQLPQDVEKINFCHSRAKARSASARFFARAWRTPVSAIEQLPQNLVHGLAVLRSLRWRIAVRLYRRDVRGRRRWRHQRAGLAAALAHALLQEVAEGFAEPDGQSATAAGAAAARGIAARAAGQSAQHAAEAAAAAEQALAHLLELGVGRIGIVEDAGHVGIDARLRPGAIDDNGNAEPDRIGGAALA